MIDPAPVFPSLPAVSGKKVSAAFDGGRITSDGGVLLLAQAEKRLGIAGRLAAHIRDDRDPGRVRHLLPDILFARYLAIAAGYEDADDLDALRHDPAFKMALGKTPEAKIGLASQPTMSRWENAPDLRAAIRMTYELIDIYCDSYAVPPATITLDIDDTFDAAHGAQQLTFWNGFHGERGYAPIHVYEAETGRPVAFVLRPAKTPSGKEIAAHVRRLIGRIRTHWPETRITIRGDGHYARPEVMAWCEARAGIDYLFGLPGNAALRRDAVISAAADACAVVRAEKGLPVHRTHCETTYAARSWNGKDRRVIARIEATTLGLDIRTIVTSLTGSTPERLYEFDYCARGQAENLIKLHKTQLKSDRTSCSSACANQVSVRRANDSLDHLLFRLTSPHRRLLAALDCPSGHPRKRRPQARRVRHPPEPHRQDRCPRRRDRDPHPRRLRLRMPRQDPLRADSLRTHREASRQPASAVADAPLTAPPPRNETCKLSRKRSQARATNPLASTKPKTIHGSPPNGQTNTGE